MRILLVGHGKMGRMVEGLAPEYGCEVAGIIDPFSPAHSGDITDERWKDVAVAVDFSAGEAVLSNVPVLARRGINIVLGTTGWQQHEKAMRQTIAAAASGIVVAANFSVGVMLFEAIVAQAARLFAARQDFGAWMHESHHAAKKDAPSGTALMLRRAMEAAGYSHPIDVASTRAGFNPGVHTVGFDGPAESITLSHVSRDRTAFARGALTAARWVEGKKGWFTMHDVLGLGGPEAP